MDATSLLRKTVKAGVLPIGLVNRSRPGDVVVLLYHRVGDGGREIDLPVAAFEDQMAYLASRDTTCSLDQALDGDGRGGTVVSVDDGFADFHEHVLPALVRHRVPAILYLATGLVADGRRVGLDDPRPLTWAQLQEAVSTGLVSVGSHTHGHASLLHASETTAEDEMRRSKELIEDRLGVACEHFAYPWAVASAAAERAALRLFRTAALPAWKTNRKGRIDLHRLGRVPVLRGDGTSFFRAKVNGMLDGEAFAYRILRRGPWGAS
jgi:peptidoglycan/xylan/chitin deacetylase (PgdA/CDA1 family)